MPLDRLDFAPCVTSPAQVIFTAFDPETKPTMTTRNEYHYLPVDDRTATWEFYLTKMGRVLDPVATEVPHGFNPKLQHVA